MLEIMENQSSFAFDQKKRSSLIIQQNAGFKSHLAPPSNSIYDRDDNDDDYGRVFITSALGSTAASTRNKTNVSRTATTAESRNRVHTT